MDRPRLVTDPCIFCEGTGWTDNRCRYPCTHCTTDACAVDEPEDFEHTWEEAK